MNTKWYARIGAAVAVMLSAAIGAPAQELQLHGRVSYDTKGMLVKGADDKDWERATLNTLLMPGDALWVDQGGLSEVELAGGSFLRLADGSKAELKSLPPAADVRGWVGSFYVQRVSRSQGTFVVTTPSCQVDVPIDSCVRVDIDEKGGATVSVRWGGAEVRTDAGAPVRLAEAQRLWVDPGYLPSDPLGFDRGESDSFDQWNNERATVLANGYKTLPKEVEVASPVVGVSDLGNYGEWVYVDNRPCWRPTVVVDYVPYRYGCWNYSPAWGNVWVGAYPFCYVTSHYGRWNYAATYGWVWSYDPVWSPAWATTICAGDYLMWAPMGWDYRPVMVTESAYFGIGGVNFCVSSTSWMPMSYVHTGWAPISPCTPWFADTVCTLPPTQINIWNIYGGGHHGGGHHGGGDGHDRPRPHPSPFDPNVFHERDYNPPRSIRGVPVSHDGPAPGARAHELESRLDRDRFTPVEHTGARMERSAGARGTAMRSVRLDNAAPLQPDTAPGLAEMRRGAAGTTPEARRQPGGGRELRNGRDNGIATLNNEAAAAARTNNLVRPGTGRPDVTPGTAGEGRTPAGETSREMRGTPEGLMQGGAVEGGREMRGTPGTTPSRGMDRSLPRGGVSPRSTMRDIDPGAPAPGGTGRVTSTPQKTPTRGMVRQTPDTAPTTSAGARGGNDAGGRSSSRMSDLPTFPPTRGSRPLTFDTDAARTTTPRVTAPRTDLSVPRTESRSPRMESAPRAEAPAPTVERSLPEVRQPQIETPQPRIERSVPEVRQPQYQTPQPRMERSMPEVRQPQYQAPQPRMERSTPEVRQPQYQAPQPRMEAPQPRFEAPRMSAPSVSPRGGVSDNNSSSSGSRGSVRGR